MTVFSSICLVLLEKSDLAGLVCFKLDETEMSKIWITINKHYLQNINYQWPAGICVEVP